jgi:hypothetical protein
MTFERILADVLTRAMAPRLRSHARHVRALEVVAAYLRCDICDLVFKSPTELDAFLDQRVATVTQAEMG